MGKLYLLDWDSHGRLELPIGILPFCILFVQFKGARRRMVERISKVG